MTYIARLYSKRGNCYSIRNDLKSNCAVYWYNLSNVRKFATRQKCRNAIKELKGTMNFDRIFSRYEITEITEELKLEASFLYLRDDQCTP
jgi:hypothetical protein